MLAPLAAALVCLAFAACGGSSKSASTAAQGAAGSTSTSSRTAPSSGTRTTSKPAAKAFGSGKPALSPAEMRRLKQFASCLRAHGVNVPPPNASSTGATLDLKGVDTAAPSVRKAEARCAAKLAGGIRTGRVHLKGVHVGGVKPGSVKIGPLHIPTPKIQPGGGTVPGGGSRSGSG